MPEIVRLTNCKICVYPGDHAPPHFHVRGPGWQASVSMFTFQVLKGKAPRADLVEVFKWLSVPGNIYRLAHEWRRLNERD